LSEIPSGDNLLFRPTTFLSIVLRMFMSCVTYCLLLRTAVQTIPTFKLSKN